MKIGQYCQRQRCKHVELEQFLAGFLRRAGLSAIAGLSCYTVRCPAPFWLIQCKSYRNRFIIAKVIDKSLGARFLMAHCVYDLVT